MKRINTALRAIFLLLFLIPGFTGVTQDVSFSQFYSNPLYLNPAFAGTMGVPRLAVQYRNQWHAFDNPFNTYAASVDFPVKGLRGGLGFYLLNDMQAANSYQTIQFNGAYSVFLRVSEDFRFHGAIQAGFGRRSLRPDKLVFPDNLDPVYGNHGISRELEYLSELNFIYPDFSVGILLYSQKIFGGMSVRHLNEPGLSFASGVDETGKLNRKYTAHVGARLPVFLYGHQRRKFDVSPHLVMQYHYRFEQINYGMFASHGGLKAGAWFRQNVGLRYDAIILLAGFAKNRWQMTYSYDIALSGLWGNTGGTSEISLIYLLKQPERGSYLPFYDLLEDQRGFY